MAPYNQELVNSLSDESTYSCYIEMPDGTLACLCQLLKTVAILSDLNLFGYEDRWCYKSYGAAEQALFAWRDSFQSMEEPEGWHRHPSTGRRRTEGDKQTEYINY